MDRTNEDRACEGCGSTVDVRWYAGGDLCPTCTADYKKWRLMKGESA